MISTVPIAPAASSAGSVALNAAIPGLGMVATDIYQAIKSAPHNVANIVVQKVENPFGQRLAEAAAIRETDPAQAQQILQQGYADYQAGLKAIRDAGSFVPDASKSLNDTVINQSLNNPKLWQTVTTLAGQLGMVLNQGTQGNLNGTLVVSSEPLSSVAGGPAQGQGFTEGDNNPEIKASELSPISIIYDTLNKIPGMGTIGQSGPLPTVNPNNPSAPAPSGPTQPTTGLFGKFLPAILAGTSIGANLLTANSTANAAKDAAKIQADATTHAAELQDATTNKALDLNKQVYDTNLANAAPWLKQGTSAINELGTELGLPGTDSSAPGYGALNSPFPEKFSFTADDLLKDPGYLTRMEASRQALERSASSKGGLFTPGVQAAIDAKIGEAGSNEFGTAHDRQLNEFLDRYNIFNTDQNTRYNRLAGVAGTGQTSVGQVQGAGSSYANNNSSTAQAGTSAINDLNTSGATATAQGNLNATKANVAGVNNSIDDITSYIAELLRQRGKV